MKLIVVLCVLITFLWAEEHRVLVSGFSKHEKSQDGDGEKFNEENWGVGYEYTNFKKYGEMYFAGNISVIKDSYSDAQYTITASPNWRYKMGGDFDFSFGAAAFLMWKKDTYKDNITSDEAEYGLVPGIAPQAAFYYKNFSVNFAYIPTIKMGSIDMIGFGIVYFGWKL